MTAARLALAVVTLSACDRREPIAACTDDLAGVYVVDGRRWMLLDNRRTLEAYPLFADLPQAPAGHEVAPRAIDLERVSPTELAGHVRRRYLRGDVRCEGKATAHVTNCAADTLEIVLADPVAPIEYGEPCKWPGPAPSRREVWRRE